MAYTGTTFIAFPNGDLVDVSGCALAVSGTALTLSKGGATHYQFKFSSAADVVNYIEIISSAVSTFNYQPITFCDWSVDGLTWEAGPIPYNAAPLFIICYGQNLKNASTATLSDSSGRTMSAPVIMSTSTEAAAGPFTLFGGSAPAQGNARLMFIDVNGIPVATTVVVIGPQQTINWLPSTPSSLAEWLKSDALSAGSISSWPAAAGNHATASGAGQPTVVANAQNGLPLVRFDGVANTMNVASFGSFLQPCTMALAFRYKGSLAIQDSNAYIPLSGGAWTWVINNDTPGPISWDLNMGSDTTFFPVDNNFHTLVFVLNGANSKYAFDGAPLTIFGPGDTAVNDMDIGSNSGLSFFTQIDFGEIAVWSVDGTNMYTILSRYLNNKWGV